jgi:hypothetical protein
MLAVGREDALFVLELVDRETIGVLWKVNQISEGINMA